MIRTRQGPNLSLGLHADPVNGLSINTLKCSLMLKRVFDPTHVIARENRGFSKQMKLSKPHESSDWHVCILQAIRLYRMGVLYGMTELPLIITSSMTVNTSFAMESVRTKLPPGMRLATGPKRKQLHDATYV